MKIKILHLILFFWMANICQAQVVETVAGPNPRINNGLVVDGSGNIYASDLFGSGFNGNRIYKIAQDGSNELVASGLSQPAGLVFDATGLLYVAEFTSGEISTIDGSGSVTSWVTGLNQPADLVFDSEGNLYVTNYGNGSLSKITAEGEVSTLTTGLGRPVGLSIDEEDVLYVASLNSGKIYRVDTDGSQSVLATIMNTPIGFMTYAHQKLYVTSTGGHRVYSVDLDGEVAEFAGSGTPGTVDGDAAMARFTNPDGIAVNSSGDTLYVSENNTNLLRRIVLDTSTSLGERLPTEVFDNIHLFPNPAEDLTRIQFRLYRGSMVDLKIFTNDGKHVQTVLSEYRQSGEYLDTISLEKLSTGAYYVQLKAGTIVKNAILKIL